MPACSATSRKSPPRAHRFRVPTPPSRTTFRPLTRRTHPGVAGSTGCAAHRHRRLSLRQHLSLHRCPRKFLFRPRRLHRLLHLRLHLQGCLRKDWHFCARPRQLRPLRQRPQPRSDGLHLTSAPDPILSNPNPNLNLNPPNPSRPIGAAGSSACAAGCARPGRALRRSSPACRLTTRCTRNSKPPC